MELLFFVTAVGGSDIKRIAKEEAGAFSSILLIEMNIYTYFYAYLFLRSVRIHAIVVHIIRGLWHGQPQQADSAKA